ncbi:FCD domain-containing protein [Streptomyces sp. ODS28]|uniref:FadR/GntR family transcriptional regulator n=1 Tax=Streptomyces sp. ODS28 TaxID=3136688 RepID=UPI0031ECBFB9
MRPVTRSRLYEQVLARLREHAAAAGLRRGDRLPSERELAERLGVSRSSVKQAIVVLEAQDLVEIRHGGGTYLLKDGLYAAAEPVAALAERRRRLPDVLDAREALETKLAELAALRRTEEDLRAITAALETMRAEKESGGNGEEGDRLFHAAVTAAAHSELLAEFMRGIAGPIAESRHESLREPGRPATSLAQHTAIAGAIGAGDAVGAAAAMREHLETVRQVRLMDWQPDAEG